VIRPSAVGIAGSTCLLVADLTWLGLVRPPGQELLVVWFAALAVTGVFLPGLANQVTMSRAHLAGPALVYSLASARLTELAAVVGLAGLSDLLDGTVARWLDQRGRLGGALDPIVDGVFFGAVAVGLALGGLYPTWLALVVVARYAVPAAAGGILLVAGRRPELHHTPLGQASTVVIAFLLGAQALARAVGWGGDVLLAVASVAVPLAALGACANLFWANRASIIGSGRPG